MVPLSILIRHGESQLNRVNRQSYEIVTGKTDTPLTPHGEEQAIEAGHRIAHIPLDFAVSSALIRAHRTAELVLAQHPRPPSLFTSDNFVERSLGAFEGQRMDDLRQQFPAYFSDPALCRWRADFEQSAPGGENLSQVEKRVLDGYELLCARLPEENFVIFSHIMALRCLLGKLFDLPRDHVPGMNIPNALPLIIAREPIPHLVGSVGLDDLLRKEAEGKPLVRSPTSAPPSTHHPPPPSRRGGCSNRGIP